MGIAFNDIQMGGGLAEQFLLGAAGGAGERGIHRPALVGNALGEGLQPLRGHLRISRVQDRRLAAEAQANPSDEKQGSNVIPLHKYQPNR